MSTPKDKKPLARTGFSRRGFLQTTGAAGAGVGLLEREAAAQSPKTMGPGEVPITLNVNGADIKLTVEPRMTLLDALRAKTDNTGAKRVCDRGSCGACSMMVAGKVVYGCTVLAIDAQGRKIETVESLTAGGKTHPIVNAFVNNDAQQCGYCTPGFVMASKAFLDRNPNPTYEQVRDGLGGNTCRCGTYVGVRKAVLEAAKNLKGASNA